MSKRRKNIIERLYGQILAKGGRILKDYLGKYEQKEDIYYGKLYGQIWAKGGQILKDYAGQIWGKKK